MKRTTIKGFNVSAKAQETRYASGEVATKEDTTLWLDYTEEGGGHFQWGRGEPSLPVFTTARKAQAQAAHTTGPWYFVPKHGSFQMHHVEIVTTYQRTVQPLMADINPPRV